MCQPFLCSSATGAFTPRLYLQHDLVAHPWTNGQSLPRRRPRTGAGSPPATIAAPLPSSPPSPSLPPPSSGSDQRVLTRINHEISAQFLSIQISCHLCIRSKTSRLHSKSFGRFTTFPISIVPSGCGKILSWGNVRGKKTPDMVMI